MHFEINPKRLLKLTDKRFEVPASRQACIMNPTVDGFSNMPNPTISCPDKAFIQQLSGLIYLPYLYSFSCSARKLLENLFAYFSRMLKRESFRPGNAIPRQNVNYWVQTLNFCLELFDSNVTCKMGITEKQPKFLSGCKGRAWLLMEPLLLWF